MAAADQTEALQAQVQAASEKASPLAIIGGNTKAFYGNPSQGEPLEVSGHSGIVNYEPTELVLTARAGTPLAEIEAALAKEGQALAFEPPSFGEASTIGGVIAAGLSGPARPYAGSARDMVLGIRLLNGKGEVMRFGGEVMKNVAGYDVSRLTVGALGTLGVILEVSLKVLPAPASHVTLQFDTPVNECHASSEAWLRNGRPLSATLHDGEHFYARLSGTQSAIEDASQSLDGERVKADDADALWASVRNHTHEFFHAAEPPIWRVSLPPAADIEKHFAGEEKLIEWSGQQVWLRSNRSIEALREAAQAAGGSLTRFYGSTPEPTGVFQPLDAIQTRLHRSLKHAFDPKGIFNPGRLYPGLEER